MEQPPASGDISITGDLHATNVLTGIQQHLTVIFQTPPPPPVDLAPLRAAYLEYLRQSYHYLDIQGIRQVQQVLYQIPLTAVYVPLKAHAGHAALDSRVAGRHWPGQANDLPELELAARQHEPVPVEVALHTDPAVVVLGDPGAGKSTLLQILALALAQQERGCQVICVTSFTPVPALRTGSRTD